MGARPPDESLSRGGERGAIFRARPSRWHFRLDAIASYQRGMLAYRVMSLVGGDTATPAIMSVERKSVSVPAPNACREARIIPVVSQRSSRASLRGLSSDSHSAIDVGIKRGLSIFPRRYYRKENRVTEFFIL